jgi:hypothetical protein
VLQAAKELAKRQHKTAGQVLSELARQAMTRVHADHDESLQACCGFQPFPPRGGIVTEQQIETIREQEGI